MFFVLLCGGAFTSEYTVVNKIYMSRTGESCIGKFSKKYHVKRENSRTTTVAAIRIQQKKKKLSTTTRLLNGCGCKTCGSWFVDGITKTCCGRFVVGTCCCCEEKQQTEGETDSAVVVEDEETNDNDGLTTTDEETEGEVDEDNSKSKQQQNKGQQQNTKKPTTTTASTTTTTRKQGNKQQQKTKDNNKKDNKLPWFVPFLEFSALIVVIAAVICLILYLIFKSIKSPESGFIVGVTFGFYFVLAVLGGYILFRIYVSGEKQDLQHDEHRGKLCWRILFKNNII